MTVTKQIEVVQNTIEFLESLGYKSGDIHDDLVALLEDRKKRLAALREAKEIGRRYSEGLGEFNPEVKE